MKTEITNMPTTTLEIATAVEGPAAASPVKPIRSLIDSLEQFFNKYAVLPPGLPLVLALWTVSTHLPQNFDCFPYLAITSPAKRCGKTRVAELLEYICSSPLRTVGITVAALFRTIALRNPTLIIDEAESLSSRGEKTEALREILNAGYKRGQKVIRCVGNDYEPQEFETFCPKVLVLIGTLPETLTDRCIPVQMKRRTDERIERFRFAQAHMETKALRRWTRCWARKYGTRVKSWYQANDLPYLADRDAELWLPVFAVCAIAAPKRLSELKPIALRLAGEKAVNEPGDLGIRLLADIRDVFDPDRLRTEDLLSKLNGLQESPWPSWNHGRGLNPHNLARMLAPFDIRSGTIRFPDDQTAKGYYRDDFRDSWECYLSLPEKRNTVTMQINTSENEVSAPVTAEACDGTQN